MKSFFVCLVGVFVAGCACAAPVNVLFDTDMYTDYDDVGALAMLHALADADECRILAIGCNTWGEGNRSVAACEVINAYYGRPDIPVGCARHGGREGKGAEGHGLPAKYPQGVRHLVSTDAPPAVDTYLGVLRTVPDKSVVLCSVGFLNNVADLLKADRELVSRKVKTWVCMACNYPEGKEYNSMHDPAASKYAFENWPADIPVVWTDFQYGRTCYSGRAVAELPDDGNPVRDAFAARLMPRQDCQVGKTWDQAEGHPSWDQTAVLIAVRGWERFFGLERGRYEMVGDKGANRWVADEKSICGRVTEKLPKAEVARILDELMVRRPSCHAARLSADFGRDAGPIRRELHSSGFGPMVCSCPTQHIATIREMGFKAARTHDWALINPGQRVCDYFFTFPLMHLDATDPKNYVFGPTDYLLKRTREEAGLDILYRLGTSIEHSGNTPHFNAAIPTDFEKVAEIFAGTVRHYNRGWADGYRWNIRYWEIWNEPDGILNMWCLPDGDKAPEGDRASQLKRNARRRDIFIRFFVTCLKRLKSEFPEIKVGGPALCFVDDDYVRPLFAACKAAGVAPDFFSWHHYCENPHTIDSTIAHARALCDEYGFTQCELIIDEWHYFSRKDYNWDMLGSEDPDVVRKVWSGPRGHNGIDSSCFALAVLSRFQTSKLDQAYFYGCRRTGAWGYMDEFRNKFKVYYGLRLFGDVMRNYTRLCAATGLDSDKDEGTATVLAVQSADGRRQALLVTDYRMRLETLTVDVRGVPPDARVTARVHDETHDCAPADFTFADGRLTLRKSSRESAAFLVTFEPPGAAAPLAGTGSMNKE